jgi:hypothetical protein
MGQVQVNQQRHQIMEGGVGKRRGVLFPIEGTRRDDQFSAPVFILVGTEFPFVFK